MLYSRYFSVILSVLNNGQFRKISCFSMLRCCQYFFGFSAFILGAGCTQLPSVSERSLPVDAEISTAPTVTELPVDLIDNQNNIILSESWDAYRQRFIQEDGRVIDWEDNARTVSEGQAYGMLRAVLIDDPDTFERTLRWAEDNLRRTPQPNDADGVDSLWAWKWGERSDGSWGVRDPNFASDADIDAITALILADRKWSRPDYLELAYQKLEDLWSQSVFTVPSIDSAIARRYLLPGPLTAFQPQPGKIYLNPSYFAPYAFRLFAEVDPNPDHDWMALVDSSYEVLAKTKDLSPQGLPADWIVLLPALRTVQLVPEEAALRSRYGFDAYRVWWRLAWDWTWYRESRARAYLEDHLSYLKTTWQEEGQIPAVMDLTGQALVDYESTSQYAMLYLAFQQTHPEIAADIFNRKLLSTYNEGIWDDIDAYYVQNLAWIGLFPSENFR